MCSLLSPLGFPALPVCDDLRHFSNCLRAGHRTAGRCANHAALDAVEAFELPIDLAAMATPAAIDPLRCVSLAIRTSSLFPSGRDPIVRRTARHS